MTDAELIAYYANLLIIQYINRTRAAATVGAFVSSEIANQIIQKVEDGFDIDTAVGVQIDAIGTYRGAARLQYGLNLDRQFFAMPLYDATIPEDFLGMPFYADAATLSWFFEYYADATSASELTDAELRSFVKYLMKLQSLNLGLGEIDQFLFEFFGSYVTLDDNGDMTITYTHDPADPNNLFAIVNFTNNLPHPAGVTINVS